MKSHAYKIETAQLRPLLVSMVVAVVCTGVLLRAGALTGVLPRPSPALDVERSILTHQAEATQKTNPSDVVFIGDSSCLMDIRAAALEEASGGTHRAQNLGSFMYLGLQGYARMLRRYAAANPDRIKTVVLLVHPQTLRAAEPVPEYERFLADFYAGEDHIGDASIRGQVSAVLGLHILEGRLVGRLPIPLPGEYGRYYGFNLNLRRYMDDQRGSATDPHVYKNAPGQGTAEFRLGQSLQPDCLALRESIPAGARLVVALSPVPQSFVLPGYELKWRALLLDWSKWMGTHLCLSNLPATLPDDHFASTTHLNAKGARAYTELVLKSIKPGAREEALGDQ